MATATRKTERVERVVVEDVDTVTLTLTVDEAETLHGLVASVYGDQRYTYRQHTEAIGDAFDKVSIAFPPRFAGSITAEPLPEVSE